MRQRNEPTDTPRARYSEAWTPVAERKLTLVVPWIAQKACARRSDGVGADYGPASAGSAFTPAQLWPRNLSGDPAGDQVRQGQGHRGKGDRGHVRISLRSIEPAASGGPPPAAPPPPSGALTSGIGETPWTHSSASAESSY